MKKYLSLTICVILLFITTVNITVNATSDEELRAENKVEFFVEADGYTYYSSFSKTSEYGNKYWYEIIEGVELTGIRVDEISDVKYQLIPETQEQKDLIVGYETVSLGSETFQRMKLAYFLTGVDSPSANERNQRESEQAAIEEAERKEQDAIKSETSHLKTLSTQRWADVIESYVYDNGDGTFTVVDRDGDDITAIKYDNDDYSVLDTKNIDFELELFGGFYSGEQYNYIVFGQNNEDEDDSKEVIRVVKYDKEFNRLSSAAVRDCYTVEPFRSSAVRMAESGSELTVHTSRKRYQTDDGLNHQSELTVVLDTDTMSVENYVGEWQSNHVSHSFNQFVLYDGGAQVLLDHGDTYPRSIVLHKHTADDSSGSHWDDAQYTEVDLFEIPGETGANCTGVTIGGFEYSDDNYLVAINTIDHSKVSSYNSYNMVGLDVDERDVVLLVSGKDNTETSDVKQVYLTDYVDNNKLGSKPYLVKLSNNRFLVMWEEFEYENSSAVSNGVKYVQVDGDGELLSDIRSVKDVSLSSDCQPTQIDDKLIWYINGVEKRNFYSLDLNTALITVTVDGDFVTFDQSPTIVSGRTLVPVRAIFEALGASVEWDGDTQTVTSTLNGTTVTLTIGSGTMYKNGAASTLDVPAQMINDRTLVPVRAIAEAFGCNVDWDGDTKTVIIES
ncbi:MAG: copper amine oxidase N-terminal domain-containing protein [Firmicutes bacterium]|nr:copper amine oxidase N-terminal domain-containing protein [Bacillota bacterium]